MSTYRFTVDGPLRGYRASVKRVFKKDPMAKLTQLAAFKEKVQWLAIAAGFHPRPTTRFTTAALSVLVRWPGDPRIDWKNVYGLIEDALFSDDRWVQPGKHSGVLWLEAVSGRPPSEFEYADVVVEEFHQ